MHQGPVPDSLVRKAMLFSPQFLTFYLSPYNYSAIQSSLDFALAAGCSLQGEILISHVARVVLFLIVKYIMRVTVQWTKHRSQISIKQSYRIHKLTCYSAIFTENYADQLIHTP